MTLGEELLQDQIDRLEADNRDLLERITAANRTLNDFRSKLREVPSFSVLPKLTRTKLTEAHMTILNLDAVGMPLCVWKVGAGDTAIDAPLTADEEAEVEATWQRHKKAIEGTT